MICRKCVFCGRSVDLDRYALFRLPPDHRHIPDNVYRAYLEIRGISGKRNDFPDVCGVGSQDAAKMVFENGKPVLTTKTGRSTDTLICPSCHNEILRDTGEGCVNTALFFGGRDSGKTSLIAALAKECMTAGFSYDDRYRYFFCDKIYDEAYMTEAASKAAAGEKPVELRESIVIFRMTGASEGSRVVCDVMHDVSRGDIEDDLSIAMALPFAAGAGHFVYCIPADKLAGTLISLDAGADLKVRLDLDAMIHSAGEESTLPELDIAVTKFDLAEKAGGAASDIMSVRGNEKALVNYIYTAFPSVEEYSRFFSGIRVYPVSAVSPLTDENGVSLTAKLYSGLFG